MQKIKFVFDVVVAVEMAPAAVELVGGIGTTEPNGRHYLVLEERRAGVVLDSETADKAAAAAKAIKTACYWYKNQNPEWKDSRLVGLNPELVKSSLVR